MCPMDKATPAPTVSFPTLVDFGCMLRLVGDWVSEDASETSVRSAANVLHALDTALRLERLGPVCVAAGHAPRALLAHLEHAATEVLRSQPVKDAATVDEILAVTKRRVEMLQRMLDATLSPGSGTFTQLRERTVSFIDLLLAQGSKLPTATAGVIAKAVLTHVASSRFADPGVGECDAMRERVTKKIAPMIESATGRGKKLKHDEAADIFDAVMREIGIGDSGSVTAAAAGSGSAKSPARAQGRRRARPRPRGR